MPWSVEKVEKSVKHKINENLMFKDKKEFKINVIKNFILLKSTLAKVQFVQLLWKFCLQDAALEINADLQKKKKVSRDKNAINAVKILTLSKCVAV